MFRLLSKLLPLTLALCLVLASCHSAGTGPAPSPSPGGPTQTLDAAQFDSLLDQQPLSVESASYVVQDQQYKALFPDMLQATVRNGTGETVTKAVVAFAAWDINGNPVAIEAKYDFIRGFYIREVTFQDLAVPAGETFGERYGFKIEESCRVARVKAIAVGCETSGGTPGPTPAMRPGCSSMKGWASPSTAQWKSPWSWFPPPPAPHKRETGPSRGLFFMGKTEPQQLVWPIYCKSY